MWFRSSLFSFLLIAWNLVQSEGKIRTSFNCTSNGVFEDGPCSRAFWYCVDGVPARGMCPENSVYNSDESMCDTKEYVISCGGTRRRISVSLPDSDDPFSEGNEEDCDEEDPDYNGAEPLDGSYYLDTKPTFLAPLAAPESRAPGYKSVENPEGIQFLGPIFGAKSNSTYYGSVTTQKPNFGPVKTPLVVQPPSPPAQNPIPISTSTVAPSTKTAGFSQKSEEDLIYAGPEGNVIMTPGSSENSDDLFFFSPIKSGPLPQNSVPSSLAPHTNPTSQVYTTPSTTRLPSTPLPLASNPPRVVPPSSPGYSPPTKIPQASSPPTTTGTIPSANLSSLPQDLNFHPLKIEHLDSMEADVPQVPVHEKLAPVYVSQTTTTLPSTTTTPISTTSLPIASDSPRPVATTSAAQQTYSTASSKLPVAQNLVFEKSSDQIMVSNKEVVIKSVACPDAINDKYCLNGGKCLAEIINGNEFHPFCVCAPNFHGVRCELAMNNTLNAIVDKAQDSPSSEEDLIPYLEKKNTTVPLPAIQVPSPTEPPLIYHPLVSNNSSQNPQVPSFQNAQQPVQPLQNVQNSGPKKEYHGAFASNSSAKPTPTQPRDTASSKLPVAQNLVFEKSSDQIMVPKKEVVIKSVACPDAINDQYCLNGGQCLAEIIHGNEFHPFCLCAPNFHGVRCELAMNNTLNAIVDKAQDSPSSEEDLIPYLEKKNTTVPLPTIQLPSPTEPPLIYHPLVSNNSSQNPQVPSFQNAQQPVQPSQNVQNSGPPPAWPTGKQPSEPVGTLPERIVQTPSQQQQSVKQPDQAQVSGQAPQMNNLPVPSWSQPPAQQQIVSQPAQNIVPSLRSFQPEVKSSWANNNTQIIQNQNPAQSQSSSSQVSGQQPGTQQFPTPPGFQRNLQNPSGPQAPGGQGMPQPPTFKQNNQPAAPPAFGSQGFSASTQNSRQAWSIPGGQNQQQFIAQQNPSGPQAPQGMLQPPTFKQTNQPAAPPAFGPPGFSAGTQNSRQTWTIPGGQNQQQFIAQQNPSGLQAPQGMPQPSTFQQINQPAAPPAYGPPGFSAGTQDSRQTWSIPGGQNQFFAQPPSGPSGWPTQTGTFSAPNAQWQPAQQFLAPSQPQQPWDQQSIQVQISTWQHQQPVQNAPQQYLYQASGIPVEHAKQYQPVFIVGTTPKAPGNYAKPTRPSRVYAVEDPFKGHIPNLPVPMLQTFDDRLGQASLPEDAFRVPYSSEHVQQPAPPAYAPQDVTYGKVEPEKVYTSTPSYVQEQPVVTDYVKPTEGYTNVQVEAIKDQKYEPRRPAAKLPDSFDGRIRESIPVVPAFVTEFGRAHVPHNAFDGPLPEDFLIPKPDLRKAYIGDEFTLDDYKEEYDHPIHDRFHGLDIKYKVEVPFASVHAPIHLDENTYDIRLSRRDPPGPILHEFTAHHKKVRLEDIYGGPVHKHEYHSKDKGDYKKGDSSESGKHKDYDEKHNKHGDHDDHYGKPRDYENGYDGSKENGHDYERPNYHGNHHEDNYEKRISADIPDGAFENIEKVDEKDSTHQESTNRNAGVEEKQVVDDQDKYENSDEEVDQIQGQKDDDIQTTTPIHEDLEESHATTTSSDSHEYEDTAQKTSTTQEAFEEQEPTTQGYTREENKADQDKKEGNGGLRQAAEAEKYESTTTTTTTASTTIITESTTATTEENYAESLTTEENYAESSTTETEEYEEGSREHNKRNFREDTTSEPSTKTTPDYLIEEEPETTANPTESTTITTPDPYENHYEIDLKSASLEEEEKGWSPHDRRKRQAPNSKKRKCKSKSPVVLDPRCIYDETTPVALGFCRVDFLLCMPKGDGYRAFCLQNQLFDQTSGKCVPAGQCGEHANSVRPTQNISSLAQNPPKTTPDLTSEEGFCVGKKNGLYMHPRNCSQIWKCTNGTVSEHPGCAPDLAFNEKRGLCDFRHTVPGCSLEEPTALGPIEGKALDPVLNRNFTIPSNTRSCGTLNHGDHIAHESDCTLYHQCVWGSLELMRCPAGTFFNPEMNVCDYSHAVPGCNASSVNNGTNSSTDSS